MRKRRGCLFWLFGLVFVCVAVGLLGYFVALPRTLDVFEENVADSISTVIADEIAPEYSAEQLQQGTEVTLSFATFNESMAENGNTDSDQTDRVEITGEGNNLVLRSYFNGDDYDIVFTPTITDTGRLNLVPLEDSAWLEEQVEKVLGGGMESSINAWLEANNIVLTDIAVDGDSFILSVTGE